LPESLQISITLAEGALLIFSQYGVEKLLAWPGIEPTPLDLSSQSGVYDLAATTTPVCCFSIYELNKVQLFSCPYEKIHPFFGLTMHF